MASKPKDSKPNGVPGPGTYTIPSQKSSTSAVFTSKPNNPKTPLVPGPGEYSY